MNSNKELIKLFISFMFAFAIMFVVLLNQGASNISDDEIIQVNTIIPSDEKEIEDIIPLDWNKKVMVERYEQAESRCLN